jgi:hypothetical protein
MTGSVECKTNLTQLFHPRFTKWTSSGEYQIRDFVIWSDDSISST